MKTWKSKQKSWRGKLVNLEERKKTLPPCTQAVLIQNLANIALFSFAAKRALIIIHFCISLLDMCIKIPGYSYTALKNTWIFLHNIKKYLDIPTEVARSKCSTIVSSNGTLVCVLDRIRIINIIVFLVPRTPQNHS